MAFVAVIPAVGSVALPALGTALSAGAGLASSIPVIGGTIGSLGSGLGSAMTALGAGNLGAAATSLGSGLLGAGSSLLPTNLLSASNLLGGLGKSFGLGVHGATPFAGEYSLANGLGGLLGTGLGGVQKIGEIAGVINKVRGGGGGAVSAPGVNATEINLRTPQEAKSDIQTRGGDTPDISGIQLSPASYTPMMGTGSNIIYNDQLPTGLSGVGVPGAAQQAIQQALEDPADTSTALNRTLQTVYGGRPTTMA